MKSAREKIQEGVRLKEEGNSLVQQKEYRKACNCYRRVFAYANGLISKDNAEMAKYSTTADLLNAQEARDLIELKVSTFNNLALCYLRLQEPNKALDCARKALAIDGNCAKALIREACACREMKLWDNAKASLIRALELEPNNDAAKAELRLWKAAYLTWTDEQRKKERDLFGGKLLS